MTMRRLFVGMMILTGLSVLSWVRADGTSARACCEPVCVDDDSCSGGNHDEALQRYRTNQTRHWRHMVVNGK